MSNTLIKRLTLSGTEFVPITLSEAVVVNTSNIPGLTSLGITTLDKVLRSTLGIVGVNATNIETLNKAVDNINSVLDNKQTKLTAGSGITISDNGVISATVGTVELYKIVTSLPNPSASAENTIYLIPSSNGAAGNVFAEYMCVLSGSSYIWEQIGSITSDVDLSGYVTTETFNSFVASSILAVNVTDSSGQSVSVDYTIPTTLYD